MQCLSLWIMQAYHASNSCILQGFNLAVQCASMQLPTSAEELDLLIKQRLNGSLKVSWVCFAVCTCMLPLLLCKAVTAHFGVHSISIHFRIHSSTTTGCIAHECQLYLRPVGLYTVQCCRVCLKMCSAMQFLDGLTLLAVMTLNKVVRAAVQQERHIYTVDNPRFIHGAGMKTI